MTRPARSRMGFLAKMATIFRPLSLTDQRGIGQVTGTSGTDAGELVSERSALGLSAVWACVNLLAGTVATLPMAVYRRRPDGSREEFRSHPLYRMLHDSPNFDQTALDFWEFMQASLELWGNAFARKQVNGLGQLVALLPILPAGMVVRRLPSGAIEYRWTENGRAMVALDAEMLHIRGFGGNPLGGMSTLTFGANTFGLARAADRAAGSLFRNGLKPGAAISFGEFLAPEERAIAETEMAAKYAGASNAGKPIILEGGAKLDLLTINPDDAQMLESRRMSIEDICRMFGVPPFLVGHSSQGREYGTGLEQQVLGFQKFALARRLKRIEQAVNKQLLTPEDEASGVFVEFGLEGLLRGDSAARMAFYGSGLDKGWLVINEVRRWENLPPVAGGDVPRLQMQNVPLGVADDLAKQGKA